MQSLTMISRMASHRLSRVASGRDSLNQSDSEAKINEIGHEYVYTFQRVV
jgi:hypothetical protein